MPPSDEYRKRLNASEVEIARWAKKDDRAASARLAVFAGGCVIALLAFYWQLFSAWWLCVPLVVFVAIAIAHGRVRLAKLRAERVAAHYRHGIARIEDRWVGMGQTGERFIEPHHVYADDLDLFGRASLFELLSIARTRAGEETLARWLLAPAPPEEIARRRACIVELSERLGLREDLAVLGQQSAVGVQPSALLAWSESANILTARWLQVLAWSLPILMIATVVVWSLWGVATPFVAVIAAEGWVLRSQQVSLGKVLAETELAFEDLNLLAQLPIRIEQEPTDNPDLRALIARLSSSGVKASDAISRLATTVQFVESRRNIILALLSVPLMYPLQVALAAERWRAQHGARVREWLAVIGEIEALNSLAAYRYEHPADPFPEIATGAAFFEATSLGHPLIAAATCVRNDVALQSPARLLLISGSNMSGKSTLLRAIGINTVLAMTGAPVRAAALRLTPLQVGASIRVNDSLQEGSSRFYAEIKRLRSLYELAAGNVPLLFLLDELLQGTNSHDRRIGADGVVRAFVKRGAIGLVSTHDLALTELLSESERRNLHFEDQFRDGAMHFDFTLRQGVASRGNGLALMRSIGLDV
jgi:MutS domain V